MDFIAGCLVTIATIYVSAKLINDAKLTNKIQVPQYTQSRSFSLVLSKFQHMIDTADELPETQAYKHNEKNVMRVLIHDSNAYWIQNNKFLTAAVVNGIIDQETTRPVDTMSMSDVELDKISFIVQKLTEGQKNDRGNPGDTRI